MMYSEDWSDVLALWACFVITVAAVVLLTALVSVGVAAWEAYHVPEAPMQREWRGKINYDRDDDKVEVRTRLIVDEAVLEHWWNVRRAVGRGHTT